MGRDVLLYWPNIIGYTRIGLLLIAWTCFKCPTVFIPLYSISIAFDGVDGWVARKLGQTSMFGAWLDVVVDNLSRGMLWSMLFEWGWMLSSVEWCVFVCNHNARSADWKNSFSTSPHFVQAIMANGFRTPLGAWVISGLHCLPLWLYGCNWGLLSHLCLWVQAGTVVLTVGRVMALAVEIWCIWAHIKYLTEGYIEEKRS